MAVFITADDLAPFADIDADKADAMIDDASAMAAQVAPCVLTDDFQQSTEKMAALKAILRGALLRWNEAGSGAVSQQTVGPFQQSIDTSRERRGMFWPSEITQLQDLCQSVGGAFEIATGPLWSCNHADICAANFGANYCSCGAILARCEYPLWEDSTTPLSRGIDR